MMVLSLGNRFLYQVKLEGLFPINEPWNGVGRLEDRGGLCQIMCIGLIHLRKKAK